MRGMEKMLHRNQSFRVTSVEVRLSKLEVIICLSQEKLRPQAILLTSLLINMRQLILSRLIMSRLKPDMSILSMANLEVGPISHLVMINL